MDEKSRTDAALAQEIIAAAGAVHAALGSGLLEQVYEAALAYELRTMGIHCLRQVPLAVRYRGVTLPVGLRADMIVGDRVIVEVKAYGFIREVHRQQLRTYLRAASLGEGLLINFFEVDLRRGVWRIRRDGGDRL